ncbi:hypothetical protein CBW65_04265 [Tumebacillus avium]|uniref:Anti-sigma-W factor RsiW n=1 Tax=Tumebacillus avium TaxID=1903704 RepID=A0A1Y0ILH7_9BACL|nr:anti-sigma factor [Tumebacillus avium]ARU60365.1 hypothetical protein CBW65_04265 [Tumebacillus avium]
MNPYTTTPCDDVELYALDGLERAEQLRFEQHLAACAACQSRLAELQDVTDALLHAPADVEPPTGMRDRVLSAVTALPQEDAPSAAVARPVTLAARRKTWQQRLFPYVSAAAVLAIALLGWQNTTLRQENLAQSAQIEQLGQLVATAALTPADQQFQSVSGQAMLLQEGSQKIVMVKASRLPQPADRQQYTLWVMNQGQTQVLNGGTFVPTGPDGLGMVVFPAKELPADFNTVAVSLEPDAYSGNTPRGVPVMTAKFDL